MESIRQRAFVVLGMHRSGTSALTRTLSMAGASLPRHLLGGGIGNELGHWEPAPLSKLHDEMLLSAGSDVNSIFEVPDEWYSSPAAASYAGRIAGLLTEEFGNSPLVVIKDPRISLFVPIWISAFDLLSIEPKFIHSFRHPVEVAHSLVERQKSFEAAGKWPLDRGLLLWLRYNLVAERATRGLPRAFINFQTLIDEWEAQLERIGRQLNIEWPALTRARRHQITKFLDQAHKHHNEPVNSADCSQLSDIFRSVFDQLQKLVSDPAGSDGTLDQAALHWNSFMGLAGGYIAALEAEAAEKGVLETQIRSVRAESEARGHFLKQLERRFAELKEKTNQRIQELEGAIMLAREEGDRLLEDKLRECDATNAELEDRHASDIQEREQAAARLEEELTQLIQKNADYRHDAARLAELELMNAALSEALDDTIRQSHKATEAELELSKLRAIARTHDLMAVEIAIELEVVRRDLRSAIRKTKKLRRSLSKERRDSARWLMPFGRSSLNG